MDGQALARAFLTIVAGECRADIEWLGQQIGRRPRMEDVEVSTWALGLVGRSLSASDYASAARLLQMAGRITGRFHEQYDLLVTPTVATPPFIIGALQPSALERAALTAIGRLGWGGALRAGGMLDDIVDKVYGFIPFTPLFNVTGQPAMSVPLFWNATGLPIGTQIVGRFGDEALLYRVAGQLERARPWAARVPC